MVPIAYNVRSLTVRKRTTLATAFGLALVVFVFASIFMLLAGLDRALGASGAPDRAIVLRRGSEVELASQVEDPQVGVVLASQHVARDADGRPLGVGEVVVVILLDKKGTDGFSNVQVRGVPDGAFAIRPELKMLSGRLPRPGTDEAVVGKAIRGSFQGVELDGEVQLKKGRNVKVVGIFEAAGSSMESEIWTGAEVLKSAFGREGLVSSVRVKLASPSAFPAFEQEIESNKQLGLEVMRETDYYEKQSEMTAIFILALGILVGFFFTAGAMIGAAITMYTSIAGRVREIGTLRALGFSRLSILVSFLLESVLLSLVGGAIGVVAALPMQLVSFSTMNFATWSEIVFEFHPTPEILLGSMVLAVVMGVLGGFFPALRAAYTNPIVAMRG